MHYASRRAGRARRASSRSTTSAAARSTRPCCARRRPGSRCSASPRASSTSAASTSTRRCCRHVRATLGGALDELDGDDPAVRSARGPAAARSASRPRRRCRPTPRPSIPVLLPGLQTEVRLTRAEFEDMIRPALARDGRRRCAGRSSSPASTPAELTRCCSSAGRRGSRSSPRWSAGPSAGRCRSTPTPSTPSRSARRASRRARACRPESQPGPRPRRRPASPSRHHRSRPPLR